MALEGVRGLRARLGWKQRDLASRIGVTQSMIAKIEAGRTQPSYAIGMRLSRVLEEEIRRRGDGLTLGEVCRRSIVWIDARDTLRAAAEILRRHGAERLPVRRAGRPVGTLSQTTVNHALTQSPDPSAAWDRRVEDLMDDPLPTLPESVPLSAASQLLQSVPAILVVRFEEPIGVCEAKDVLAASVGSGRKGLGACPAAMKP